MSPGVQGRWSWIALATWLAKASLVALISAGLLLGPSLADAAWDRGVHVTPGQVAAHNALIAAGFSHHHVHGQSTGSPSQGEQSNTPGVSAGASGSSWGSPITPAARDTSVICLALAGCWRTPSSELWPRSISLTPLTPPPEAR